MTAPRNEEAGRNPPVEASGGAPGTPRPVRPFRAFVVVAVVLLVAGAAILLQRRIQFRALARETEARAVPTVAVIRPATGPDTEELVLPGTMQAFVEAPIYARTNGYLKRWTHDIGSTVRQGDVLAEIEAPEVDAELASARANLATAQANEALSRITDARYRDLLKTDSVSKQEADNAAGDLAAKSAVVRSLEANVRRLEELKSFQRVYSPFSGVVTRRNVDIGTLVNAGNGGASQLLFVVAQTDPMRVYVNVPEAFAASVRPGLDAYLSLTQLPGRRFEGKVVRTAQAIDPATHALLTEVDVPNPSGALLPGGYAQVHLETRVGADRILVPVNALLFRSDGLQAAAVGPDDRVQLRSLTVGRDYGTSLEIVAGLSPGERIVLNPPDGIEGGQLVHVREVANPLLPASAREKDAGAPAGGAKPASPGKPSR